MNIQVKSHNFSTALIITADNVKMEEELRENLYGVTEDGKKDFKNRLGDDISDEGMLLLIRPLEDLIYYRRRDYDSSGLIKDLIAKLPEEKRNALWADLVNDYDFEQHPNQ